jgi:hypothetical protein
MTTATNSNTITEFMFTYTHHNDDNGHIHDYNIIAYNIPDEPFAHNVLHNYPKLNNYYIIITRHCYSDINCSDRWMRIKPSITHMFYEGFIKMLDGFVDEIGKEGEKVIGKFKADTQTSLLNQLASNFIQAESDEEYILLRFPNFLPKIKKRWIEKIPNGEEVVIVKIVD